MSRIRGPYVRFCERDEAVTPHPTRCFWVGNAVLAFVYLICELETTLRFFFIFLLVVGYCIHRYKDSFPKVVWISMTVWSE